MAEAAHEDHKDPSFTWLIFFFVCFGLVMLGIVFFFAHDINKETPTKLAPAHGGMLLPSDGKYESHIQIHRVV